MSEKLVENLVQTQGPPAEEPRRGCSPFRWLDVHFGEMIAVIAALVTVLGGVVAFMETWASGRYDAYIRRSQALAMDALGHDMSSRQRENYDFYLYTTWNEWDWRRIRAVGRDENLDIRASHVISMIVPLTPLLDENQPYFDTDSQLADFGAYYVDTNLITTTMLLEERTFAIETASIWNGKADGYVTILTLLSVALFLFGLSVVVKGGMRYLFTAAGVLLVGLALLWTLILALIPAPTVPDEAIVAYSQGVGLSYLGDYEGAKESFDTALQAYPDYGNAYFERGRINLWLQGYTAAVEDFEQAIENGHGGANTYWDLGWAYYLAGDYAASVKAGRQALALNPDLVPVVMNVGTALLAAGDTEAALGQYGRGLFMAADPSSSVPASWNHLYLRLTVADLDSLIAALDGQTDFADEPDLSRVGDRAALRAAAEVARLYIKEGMVSIEAAGVSQIERTTAELSSVAFGCYVGRDGELVGQGDTFARGTLAVVASLAYDGLPEGAIVSRRVARQWGDTPDTTQDLPTMGADVVWGSGSEGDLQHVMKAPWPGDRGLQPGRYTVEYYVNGYLLQTGGFTVPDKEALIFGPLVFVTEYASGGTPRDPARLFPEGLEKLRALFNYSGVPEDAIVQVRWYRDGELYDWEDSTAISGWGYDAFSIDDVAAGSYRLEISLEGRDEVLQSAGFEVVTIEDYLSAIGSEPDDPLFHRNLGDAYVYVGEYEQAAARYQRATEIDPQCAQCYYRWWSVLYEQGAYKEAVPKLERAVALWPKEYEYLSDLARTYYEMGNDEKGTDVYRQAVPINPARVYNRWGNTFYNLERYEEAAVKYQQSIELNPNDAVVHANLSGAYWDLEAYDEAVAAIEAAVALDPEYAWAYNRWGNVLYDQELYAQAAEKYEKAAALAPGSRLYRSNVGWAYFKLDMYEEAADAFQRATEIDSYASDYNMWGRALYELGLYQESVEKYQWAIDLSPQNGLYYYNLGWAYYYLADDAQAVAAFEEAADLAASQGDDDLLLDAQEALEMFQ